ncbi:MAG: hypothetical protein ACK56I_04195, partial [bacterium]
VIAMDMLRDEARIMRAEIAQRIGQREAQHHVGSGMELDMQIGLLGDLRAQRIDDGKPAARAACLRHLAHQVQVGDGSVVAPQQGELRHARCLRPDAWRRAIGADPGLGPHAAAHGP